ncbi:hypothetical protein SAMN05421890_0007 [Ensifer adhaerens]|nr:hypothetical protein SAMN05421890_0007 [Ensifer adhaerens]
MTAAKENLTDEAVLGALEALILGRSSPQLERYYTQLLFHRANGDPLDISAFAGLEDFLGDPSAQEFLRLVQLL